MFLLITEGKLLYSQFKYLHLTYSVSAQIEREKGERYEYEEGGRKRRKETPKRCFIFPKSQGKMRKSYTAVTVLCMMCMSVIPALGRQRQKD